MKRAYYISAPRNVRALYYAAEYGVRGANRLLAQESRMIGPTRTMSGIRGVGMGLYRTRRAAQEAMVRVVAMAANQAGLLGRGCGGTPLVSVEQVVGGEFAPVSDVRIFGD